MNSFKDQIVFYDNHLVVANKPAGMLSQKDKTGDDSILEKVKDFIKITYNKPGEVFLGSVHRLDRPASGLMVFAKTSKSLSRMHEKFRNGAVEKTYLAILEGCPDKIRGKLIHYLKKDANKNMVRVYDRPGRELKKALLSYEVLENHASFTLVSIKLETGRAHQIRAQFSAISCPIVGDLKYGAKNKTDGRSICLLSYRLGFIHPVTRENMLWQLPYPKDLRYWDLFDGL